jgi:uncharacterized protein (TIGR02596 family)
MIKTPLSKRLRAFRAFSLIEMLVVVTIVVLLLAFSAPALSRTLMASKLSAAGESIFGAISEAQQIAYASNVPVELRFFKVPDAFGVNPAYRSYQIFKIIQVTDSTGGSAQVKESLEPVNNLVSLPESVIIVPDITLSPALSGDGLPDTKEGSSVGYSGVQTAVYNAWRFMPDGSCRKVGQSSGGFATLEYQTLTESFITLTTESGQVITAQNLPKNFFTIQVDPFTGKARTYKPGF